MECKIMKSSSAMRTFEAQFGKKIIFRPLYDFFKHSKRCIFNRKIPKWSCLCEICGNAPFLANAMNKKLFSDCRLPVTTLELVAKFSCSEIENCMTGECNECSSPELSGDFNTISTFDSGSLSPSDTSNVDVEDENMDEDSISYYE